MNVVNETPFLFAPFTGKVIFPKNTLTMIVKGTFGLIPDQTAKLLEPDEQLPPTGDLFHDDDPQSSCRYESDFTHFKPRADVLLAGHCHVPGGKPKPASAVRFQAGGINKSLMVFGDRQWRRNRMGMRTMSDPEPFVRMELRYENSFGGPGYKRNPVGKGIRPKKEERDRPDHELPNLKVLEGEQLKTMHQGIPSGFGPLGRTWSHRMDLVGTYGDKWKKERWPWLAEDLDWGYFNAAPTDQQVKGYLTGDESLYFENMHPEHNRLHSSLPGIRVRCFLSDKCNGQHRFREVNTHLDTLWVDMDAEILVLVWRGLATVASPECDQIEDLLIVQEPVKEDPQSIEHYEQLLNKRKAEAAAAAAPMEEEEQEEVEADGDDDAAAVAQEEAELEASLGQAMTQAHGALDKSGLDPKLVSTLKAEKDPERFIDKLVQGMNIDPRALAKVSAHSRKKDKEMLDLHRPEVEKLLVKHGHDPSLLDEVDALLDEDQAPETPPAPDTEELAAAARSGEDMADQDLSGADFSGMSLEGANFKEAQLEGANFSHAHLAGADFSEASLENVNFEDADLTGANLIAADLSSVRLTRAKLTGADLSGAVLTAAMLHEASLEDAVLTGAQLGRADLSQAALKGANLEQADLTKADLTQTNLIEATLDFAVLDGADLTQADLSQVKANNVSFRGCMLLESNFSHAKLEESNFSEGRCDHANFQAAMLARATFEGAVGHHVNFREAVLDQMRAGENARLPGIIFRRACGAKGNWAGADLQGADLILADMPYCDFSQANLAGSDCRTAELKQSVFDKACLNKVQFNRANLFQTRMEEADLTGTNFKGANLYGSEFLNATIDKKTNFKGANLKGTKLATMKT